MSVPFRGIAVLFCAAVLLCAQSSEEAIRKQIGGLRKLPDDVRARTTRELALEIRRLADNDSQAQLAVALASMATEGDFGRDTLQEVTTTLAQALRAHPVPANQGAPAYAYRELASLVRYEHMQATLEDPQFAAAMSRLEADDRLRAGADFTLQDLHRKEWNLKSLRGKVVLVNFWATWCPPCRKEMPDLEELYRQFKDRGLVILALSDEQADTVQKFLGQTGYTYPVLLDPGGRVKQQFQVDGIPKTFIYGRDGTLAAQSIDMRTRKQFLEMLRQAGLQ